VLVLLAQLCPAYAHSFRASPLALPCPSLSLSTNHLGSVTAFREIKKEKKSNAAANRLLECLGNNKAGRRGMRDLGVEDRACLVDIW